MASRKRSVVALVALFISLIPIRAVAQEWPLDWHWIIVRPNDQKNWTVDQGTAKVELSRNGFMANTNDGSFVLKGTIVGWHVTATGTTIGTDMDPIVFHGDIQSVRTRLSDPSNGWGWDRISLTSRGGFYAGLYRRVRSGAAPAK